VNSLLFDPRPKTKREELFDRETELKELEKALKTYPIVTVNGLRRIGKSSILKVFASEGERRIYIDLRKLLTSKGRIEKKDLVEEFRKEIRKISRKIKIADIIKRVKGVDVLGMRIEMDWREIVFSELFEAFNDIGVVIIFDEAQLLSRYGRRGGRDLLVLFSYIYDNLENVTLIMSGSEIGLLHDFLRIDDYESPLYGRAIFELDVKPFDKNLSKEFLKKGFEEVGVKARFDMDLAVETFDGIVGYLVLFGLSYVKNENFEKAVEETFSTVEKLVLKELKELKKRTENYLYILEAIAKGFVRWGAVKSYLKAKDIELSESRMYRLLKNLEKMSWIEISEETYKIADPVIEKLLRRL